MTNALVQNNIKVEDNSAALDMLMQATNVSSETKTQDNKGFSNIMNNLESRFQKAQNDFEKKAKVTNTSSINQKALNKKEAKEIDTTKTNVAVEKNVKDASKNTKVVQQDVKKSVNETPETTEPIKKEVISEDENLSKEIKKDTSNNNSQNLSDINNSSPVESSPVFSSDENEIVIDKTSEIDTQEIEKALKEVEVEVEKLVSSIPVVDENVKIETKDLKTEIENAIKDSENIVELTQKIEEISASLNNSTLNQEQKNEISKALDEIKNLLEDIQKEIQPNVDFKSLLDELKQKASKLMDGIMLEVSENLNTKDVLSLDLSKSVVNQKDVEAIVEQSKVVDSVKLDTKALEEVIGEVETLIKDIKDTIDSENSEKLGDLVSKIPETIEKVNNFISSNDKEIEIEFDKKLVDALKNLQDVLDNNVNVEKLNTAEQTFEADFSENSEIFETLDKLSNEEFKNIETDKKTLDELLNVFDELSTKVEDLKIDDEIKAQIETKIQDLIKQVNNNTLSNEQLNNAINDLTNDIKVEVENSEIASIEVNETVETTQNLEKLSSNNNEQNQNFDKKDNFDFQNQELDVDFPEITDENIQTKEINLKGEVSTDDIQEVEQNLQKTIAIDNIMDEMMVEVDIKTIPTQSGALSVADEVAKLAMGENNSLNPITSAHGNVTYDSTGVNAIIKNAANLMKSAQVQNTNTPSMEDVLNQVTNKITQLKDGVTQKLTMILRPNDLGRLQIELNTNQNGLSTHIIAQNEDVRAYIERNIDSLRQQLSDAGVNVNSIQIKTAGSEGSTSYEGNQNFNREQNQENLNQQNQQNSQNENHRNNKQASEIAAQLNNYDMHFVKDFSSVLNKTLNYNLN